MIPITLRNSKLPTDDISGKPGIRLSNEAKESKKNIQLEALSKCKKKMLEGDLAFYIDIDVASGRMPDIDALLKQLYDAFEGIYYFLGGYFATGYLNH